jgi:membrane associated rhomboid family serine protease
MIPLRDDVPARTFPIVNVVLIVLNVLAFALEWTLGPDLDPFLRTYALVPSHFVDKLHYPLHWTPVFASMFLHGGLAHLGGNMLYLWVFGDNVEDRLGHLRYLFFYLAAGVAAALTHIFFEPHSRLPMVGASGAIAGVLGAYFMSYPRARVLTWFPPIFIFRVPALFFLGFWFVLQVLNGGMTLHASYEASGGVAFMAHVGGFVAGIGLYFLIRPANRAELPPEDYLDRYRYR